jgi:hypothetical protein
LRVVPEDAPRFNEAYANYTKGVDKTSCPCCGKDKPNTQHYCSYVCAGKSNRKVDWDSIDLLYELKTKSKVQLAAELGISDSAVHKRLKKIMGV